MATSSLTATLVAALTFAKSTEGDHIDNRILAEIVRRLVVTIDSTQFRDVIRSESPPSNTSKIWFQPSTRQAFVFNSSSQEWEDTVIGSEVQLSAIPKNLIRKDTSGALFMLISASEEQLLELDDEGAVLMRKNNIPERFDKTVAANGSGAGTIEVSYAAISDKDAAVIVMPTEDLGANGRWWVSGQDDTSATIEFAGLTPNTSFSVAVIIQQASA